MTQSVTFDRAADFYDATRSYPPEVEMLVADLIVQAGKLDRNSHVAEVGVGTGRVALPVAKRVGRITGIDLSRLMMNRLRAKQNGEPIHLVEGDITLLPFQDQAFDAVMASHIFHLVPGWQQALREVTRVLKPGAPLIHIWQQDNDLFRPLWKAWQEALGGRSDDMVVDAVMTWWGLIGGAIQISSSRTAGNRQETSSFTASAAPLPRRAIWIKSASACGQCAGATMMTNWLLA